MCVAATVFALTAAAEENAGEAIEIEPQPLPGALREFSEQTGLQLAYVATLARGKTSPGTRGETQPEEALDEILDGAELKYQYVNEHTVAIGPDRSRAPTPAAGARFAAEPILLAQAQMPPEQKQDEGDSENEAGRPATADEQPLALDRQVVTGTRLRGGDPSARVYSFTAEDISGRGVSNLEEFFRKMPWQHSTLNTQTGNAETIHRGGRAVARQFPGNGLGISSVNLRGMGWENTLVLLNGRRIAGVPGQEDDFANLLNVPLSALERVDVQLDGASAVYGSDAIGGVVNFITRKNYRGLTASYRHEFSSTDADQTRASVTGGYAWGSGNITAIVTQSTREPITNAKTGWSTLDFRPLLGPDFDLRLTEVGQPGVACEVDSGRSPTYASLTPYHCLRERRVVRPEYPDAGGVFSQTVYYQLPAGHSGEGATADDFVRFARYSGRVPGVGYLSVREPAPVPYDTLPVQNGTDSDHTSVTLSMEQYVTDRLRLYAEFAWSANESSQEYDRVIGTPFIVPASNAYNPFGKPMRVEYAAVYEGESGTLPAQYNWSENESRTLVAGFIWDINERHQLELEANRTKSWRQTEQFRVVAGRARTDPTAAAFYAALASSDPAVAINVFGDGTAQGSDFEEFLAKGGESFGGVNDTRQYRLTLRGQSFDFWGAGAISYVVGTTYRENIIHHWRTGTRTSDLYEFEEPTNSGLGSLLDVGLERPSRDASAYYGELAIPIVGPDMDVPAMHSLVLTLQFRYDVGESEGARDGREDPRVTAYFHFYNPFIEDWDYITRSTRRRVFNPSEIVTARASSNSPRIGLQYKPTPNVIWRASWRRSFKAPNWSDQFGSQEPSEKRLLWSGGTRQYLDPYDPDGPTLITRDEGVMAGYEYYVPDLKAEYSNNWSLGFDWSPAALPGLRWRVDWSLTDFTNRITSSLNYVLNYFDIAAGHDQIVVRNERGDITEVIYRNINLAESKNELISTDIEYAFDTRWGEFRPRLGYSRYLDHFDQLYESAPEATALGTQYGVDKYKWQGSLSWTYGRWQADVWLYFTPGNIHPRASACYHDFQDIPDTICKERGVAATLDVASLTTVDLNVTYRMDSGLRIRAGGQNVLDRSAPLTLSSGSSYFQPYDATRWDARGRVLFLEATWEM